MNDVMRRSSVRQNTAGIRRKESPLSASAGIVFRRRGTPQMGALVVLAFSSWLRAAEPISFFAFDDHALPFKSNLKLTFSRPQKHPGNPIVAHGPPGSVDAAGAVFYGSIIRVGAKYRMWYRAQSDGVTAAGNVAAGARLAYAESDDGLSWVKPELGLTEFNGNKRNNLLGMPPGLDYSRTEPLSCFVLHEPEDPNPERRYKMAVYGRYYPSPAGREALRMAPGNVPSSIYPFFSADGLTWTLATPAPKQKWYDETEVPFPVRNNFEIGGLYTFDGLYYVTGQELSPDVFLPDGSITRRTMVTHWSGDFVRWSHDRSLSFHRYGYRSVRESLQEAHVPAAIWNRGNVLLGTYGVWHGAVITGERRMDLGFLLSNDGIHFREPIPDHVFIPRGEDGSWDERGLLHGQGFEDMGDQTFIYYGSWDISQENRRPPQIGVVMLPRDRIASLSLRDPVPAHCTSQPIANDPSRSRGLWLNADGLGENAVLRVELIDKKGEPVAGYAGAAAAVVKNSGLKVKVVWRDGKDSIRCSNAAFRIRIAFEGAQAVQVKFYAAYLE
jgi:hypothetical protein